MIIRKLRPEEYDLLPEFLYEAIFVPEGEAPPPRDILQKPELRVYYEGFGAGGADAALAAEAEGQVVGLAWSRIMDDYGHLDDDTPSLAIALRPEFRGRGLGGALLSGLLAELKARGFARVSLSVQKANRARRLYRRLGFETAKETEEELLMLWRPGGPFRLRRFRESDAPAVSAMIRRTLRVSNGRDYPEAEIDALVERHGPAYLAERAAWTHFYVAEARERIIGCGSIGPWWGSETESGLFTIFVSPEWQGEGVGRALMQALERDDYALRARRIEIPASITGLHFYQNLGYAFREGSERPDPDGLYRLEKFLPEDALVTDRLILRRWRQEDAEDLYRYAKDPEVGPIAGWPPHKSVEESREIIRSVLSGPEAWAICLKEDGRAIGAIELKLYGGRGCDLPQAEDECEIGCWLGKPFWGRGIVPEAARALLGRAFENLGMEKVWWGYYEGNERSKRAQEKLGFRYQWTTEGLEVPLLGEIRTGYVNRMTREEWDQLHRDLSLRRMIESDARALTEAERAQGWHADIGKYQNRLRDQAQGRCISLTAVWQGRPAGYVSVYTDVDTGPFAGRGWPQITDLGVLEKYRRRGIGTRLMEAAEAIARRYSDTVCLAVGLHSGYGSAQRLYARRGYMPDGSGAWYGNRPCPPYAKDIANDDELVLYLSRKLEK